MAKLPVRPFTDTLRDLADEKYPPAKDDLRTLADLSDGKLEEFKKLWEKLAVGRRLIIMTTLGELAEEDLTMHFSAVGWIGLRDSNASIRAAGMHNLIGDEDPELVPVFLKLLTNDPSPEVREAAAIGLGTFVYLGALEEVEPELVAPIEETLLAVVNGDDVLEVRRRALESVGYSPRAEVSAAIQTAYRSPDEPLKISAMFAMGRTLDNQWAATVLHELHNLNPQFRFEAVRAAGELQLPEAVKDLTGLTHDVDDEVQEMAIWALGEIGSEEARETLTTLLKTAKGTRAELIDDALANAEVMDDVYNFQLFDLNDLDDEMKRRLN